MEILDLGMSARLKASTTVDECLIVFGLEQKF